MTIADLLQAILVDRPPTWASEFEEWVRTSRRFRAFAETYRDKIRKKMRVPKDDAGLGDLYYELETAYRLLQDQRMVLEYEKLGLLKQRAPDFTIAFRVNTIFNLEVTRLRSPVSPDDADRAAILRRKIIDAVCDKLGQMPPSAINVILMVADFPAREDELATAMTSLIERANRGQDDFFVGRGFKNSADFRRQLRQVSIILCKEELQAILWRWSNPQAKHPVPPQLANALYSVFS